MTKVGKVNYMSREFQILEDEHGFWAIESKYIRNGKLTKEFNGISGLLSETADEAKTRAKQLIDVDALVESGMDRMTASIKVIYGIG